MFQQQSNPANREELRYLPDWRFCRVAARGKNPLERQWQNYPLTLDQVESHLNIGVIFGPSSNGVMAVDFDGDWAWRYWDQHIGAAIPQTVSWSSCKPGRAQMAFQVPQEYWPYLGTKKQVAPAPDESGKKPGIEFRWEGAQSVLPPSINPDTQAEYVWLSAPSQTAVAMIPNALLAHWLEMVDSVPQSAQSDSPAPKLEEVADPELRVLIKVLTVLKARYPQLDYDTWTKVSWAAASVIGPEAAKVLMRDYWPEQKRNEYDKLLRGYNYGRSPKIGTLIQLVGPDAKDIIKPAYKNVEKLQAVMGKLKRGERK